MAKSTFPSLRASKKHVPGDDEEGRGDGVAEEAIRWSIKPNDIHTPCSGEAVGVDSDVGVVRSCRVLEGAGKGRIRDDRDRVAVG